MDTVGSRAYMEATGPREERARARPADAFVRARQIVATGERLDMLALAAELGIARATLYRWTGDREQLLSDVLWTSVDALLQHVMATTPERGVAGLRVGVTRFLTELATADMLRSFLTIEGRSGLDLITDTRGIVRPRLVQAIRTWIEHEADAGAYRPPEDPQVLADGMVSLGERFLYNGGDVERDLDAATASRMIALLIREPA